MLKTRRKLFFNLGQLFPNMSYPVVEQLDRSLFDDLFFAQEKITSDRMGDNATKDFILHHVFKITAELISTEKDLLRMLLRLHYSNMDLPLILAQRLLQVIQHHKTFHDWPLEEIVCDAQVFFAFLQERWPIFLNTFKGIPEQIDENFNEYGLKFKEPELLPFADPAIKQNDRFFKEKPWRWRCSKSHKFRSESGTNKSCWPCH